jgi:hypothetical protein
LVIKINLLSENPVYRPGYDMIIVVIFQDLCHVHSDRALVQQKTVAITNCFIDSPIPPSLQVDITQDMADKILDRKLEATPYLFREAQVKKTISF